MKNTIEPKNSVVFFIYTKTEKKGKKNDKNNLSTKLLALPNRRFSQSYTSKVKKSHQNIDRSCDWCFAAGGIVCTFRRSDLTDFE